MSRNPFIPIITPYLDYLAAWCGNLANQSVKHGVSTGEIVQDYLSDERRKAVFDRQFPDLCGYVINFWKNNLFLSKTKLADCPGMRARFGGDIGPQIQNKLYERVGVYFDSIIVPDPLLRTVTAPGVNGAFYFLKYCTNLTLTRDAFLSDVYPPIAVLTGERHLVQSDNYFDELSEISKFDTVLIANQFFDKNFESFDEVIAFFKQFDTDSDLFAEVADESLLFLDDTVERNVAEQLAEADRETKRIWGDTPLRPEFIGPQRILFHHIHGRMMQVNGALLDASETSSHPVIQAPVTFHWLTSKLKANSAIFSEVLEQDLQVQLPLTNALLAERLEWLANIPFSDLIHLRERGFLGELREVIGKNIKHLGTADLSNLEKIVSEVDYNLSAALNVHQDKIQMAYTETLDGLLVAPAFLIGIAGMVLPLFGIVHPLLLAGVGAVLGKYTLKDLLPGLMKLKREREALEKTPIGILWSARETS